MTNEEFKLISVIRSCADPTKAVATAIRIVTEYLEESRNA